MCDESGGPEFTRPSRRPASDDRVLHREGDPAVHFVEWVLSGIHDQEQRERWVREWLPRTSALILACVDFEHISDPPSDGSGAIARRKPAA
jgi:hypothetical protein